MKQYLLAALYNAPTTMQFNHDELMLIMLYNTGIRQGLVRELRLMQCYLMPDETALRELSEQVIEKLKRLTDAEFAGLEFPMNRFLPPAGGVHKSFRILQRYDILKLTAFRSQIKDKRCFLWQV